MINWLKGYYDKDRAQDLLCFLALVAFVAAVVL